MGFACEAPTPSKLQINFIISYNIGQMMSEVRRNTVCKWLNFFKLTKIIPEIFKFFFINNKKSNVFILFATETKTGVSKLIVKIIWDFRNGKIFS